METNSVLPSDVGPVPARVPGTVQQALHDAGILPDWHVGLNSRACEWVEHRQWQFRATVPAGAVPAGEAVLLHAESLDYSGWVYLDGVDLGTFSGALAPHQFAFPEDFDPACEHVLDIVFDTPPDEQGQIGFTSRSRFFKPRYNYSWDWCPRMVPTGIGRGLALRTGLDASLSLAELRAELDTEKAQGSLRIRLDAPDGLSEQEVRVRLAIDSATVLQTALPIGEAVGGVSIPVEDVRAWWPNGMGRQALYTVTLAVGDWKVTRRVGFRRIEWKACDGAPADAEPWICVVNGEPVFLQGMNWSPIRLGYQDTTAEEYRRLVGMYRDMGCTTLRVWGGAYLESTAFYDACDEAGLLVWQEFPLSSSGVDNWPPEDPDVIENMVGIARYYIRARGHHASLLMWTGGNELQGGPNGEKTGMGTPVDYSHPCIAALRDVVAAHDPGRRFLSSSASGPREFAVEEEYGKGVHHEVHGPWGMGAKIDLEAWRRYWEKDDALFRSEVGMPGAQSWALTEKYSGGEAAWPPEGPYWMHTAAWWTQWPALAERVGDGGPAAYVEETQRIQAEAYAIAAKACKDRFPGCGGFIVWHGHDCFPCPANNSIIDFEHQTKPAYHALKTVFLGEESD